MGKIGNVVHKQGVNMNLRQRVGMWVVGLGALAITPIIGLIIKYGWNKANLMTKLSPKLLQDEAAVIGVGLMIVGCFLLLDAKTWRSVRNMTLGYMAFLIVLVGSACLFGSLKARPIEYDRAPSDIQTVMPEVWYEYEPDLFPLQDDQNA